ncbi:SDR family oxidoreductase [Candidatus Marinimicrobia bacterium MT.SAG.4]|nr:SDR family oxidoreductase [Candidatus Marinimicrobia bacterium MT.SAG.4]
METLPKHPYSLNGKTVLITGAAGLLGPEHAAALLEIGARVALTDVNETTLKQVASKLYRRYGKDNVLTLIMDVTDPKSIARVRKKLEAQGGVDILINNAAINPKMKKGSALELSRLEHFPLEDWEFQMKVGLTGAFLCSKEFGSAMAERGEGVILNIASDLSVIAPDQRLYGRDGLQKDQQPVKPVTYSVIKTALIGLTRYLASYWADKGVRANALSPGGIYDGQPEKFVKRLKKLIPMNRMASKEEYRAVVQFLCSDASKYMTGQNILVDGGRSII